MGVLKRLNRPVRFSIVTPSLNSLPWLPLCAASVADQEWVAVEHIVQDGGSTDGAAAWLQQQPRLRACIGADRGMYDAVNRGFARATGDVLAYLNCDEQYLPGTLSVVSSFLEDHPEVEAAFGHVVVVDARGEFVCERRMLTPRWGHTRLGGNLAFFTAATFIRRTAWADRQLTFDPDYRAVGDAVWGLKLIATGVRMAVIPRVLSTFTETRANLGLGATGLAEFASFRGSAPWWLRLASPAVVLHHRWRRWRAGHYQKRPLNYAIYTLDSPNQRRHFHVETPTFRWQRSLRPREASKSPL